MNTPPARTTMPPFRPFAQIRGSRGRAIRCSSSQLPLLRSFLQTHRFVQLAERPNRPETWMHRTLNGRRIELAETEGGAFIEGRYYGRQKDCRWAAIVPLDLLGVWP